MAFQQFVVSDTNPNDNHGGGGCVCDPVKQVDCKPPYIVLLDTYLEDPRSPMTVICQRCADAFSVASRGEALSVGERNPHVEIITTPEVRQRAIEAGVPLVDDEDVPEV